MKKSKPKMHIASCSFGKDSIATILLALEKNEPLDRVVFSEVMFDHERGISGEIPEHIEWVYDTAIPKLESMGIKVDVVKSDSDYVSLCKRKLTRGKNEGKCYGHQNCFPCYANSELKIRPIKKYYRQFKDEYDIVEYVGIARNEKKRIERLKGTNKVSLLDKYRHTESWALWKCKQYGLLSPLYSMGYRGGCFFCYNANLERYCHIKEHYPNLWESLRKVYYESNSSHFKFNKTLEEIEKELEGLKYVKENQLKLL